ncbi:iron permease FTR1 [Thermobaculum terrenum ATCC BAA-798]|uniref:Iron permease FTR1 n=1 Tax=Thermobaculum terrenum (strain ATCC BAA-798 / CCMEE 7001 / YNP1) TaxID=525904 RepID=D1CGQ0_THET1|nr:FTR1 family protein [Thermobaculum terrenum]ACZ42921.1 iron permease FTR1 [Thermobaculum terrenum ATCC BAA-798]
MLRAILKLSVMTLVLVAVLSARGPSALAASEQVDVEREVAAIRSLMAESLEAYRAGDRERAYTLARAAYLDHFELVEIPLRIVDSSFTLEMEYKFAHWRSRIEDGAPVGEIEQIVRDIDGGLDETLALLQGPGMTGKALVTIASFSILFREGLEVILVLAALFGYVRTRDPRLRRPIALGALLAIPASIVTWALLSFVLNVAPVGRELLEAVVSLVAVAFLFYVSFWLLQRMEVRHWMEFLRSHVWEAVAAGNASALAVLGFVSVYREGAETALFYQALLWMAENMEAWILLGILLATAVLAVIGYAILWAGARLPVRVFLTTAMVMVMLLSVAMLGNAVRELQDADVISITSLFDTFPRINPFVAQFLGIYPTVETVAAQVALLLVYVIGGVYFYLGPARRARLAEARTRQA